MKQFNQLSITNSKLRMNKVQFKMKDSKLKVMFLSFFLFISISLGQGQAAAAAGGGVEEPPFPPVGPGGGETYYLEYFGTTTAISGQINLTFTLIYDGGFAGTYPVDIYSIRLTITKGSSSQNYFIDEYSDNMPFTLPNFGDGDYSIYAYDPNGQNANFTFTANKDGTPPTGLVVGNVPSSAVNSSSRNLTVTATDMVAFKYKLKKNSAAWPSSWSSEITSGSFTINHDANQEYTQHVKVIARDAAGNWTTELDKFYSVDRLAPSVPVFNTSDITWTNSSSINTNDNQIISIHYVKPSGASYVKVIAVSGSGVNSSGNLTASSGNFSDTGVYDSQTISYKIQAFDALGNSSTSATRSLAIGDRTPPGSNTPTVTWLDQGVNTADAQKVKVDFTLASGVTKVKVFKVNGNGTNDSGDYTANGSYTDLAVEDNQSNVSYYLRSYDAAGNYSNSSQTATSIGNRTAPAVPASSWLSTNWLNSSLRNTGDAQQIKINLNIRPDTGGGAQEGGPGPIGEEGGTWNNISHFQILNSGTGTTPIAKQVISWSYEPLGQSQGGQSQQSVAGPSGGNRYFLYEYQNNAVHDGQSVSYTLRVFDSYGNYSDLSKTVVVGDRTAPSISNTPTVTWLDQGINTGDAQKVKVDFTLAAGVTKVQVLKESGTGTDNSPEYVSNGSYTDIGIADYPNSVSYKLRSFDAAGNYKDTAPVVRAIGDRTAPAVPSVNGTIQAGSLNSEKGNVTVSWNAVTGVHHYDLFIFNGNTYESFNVGNVTSFNTAGKYIFPTNAYLNSLSDDALGTIYNHNLGTNTNGNFADMPDIGYLIYRKTSGETYDNSTNYWFRVQAVDAAGNKSDVWANYWMPTLPDRTAPAVPANPTVTWLDQGANSNDAQKVKVDFILPSGATKIKVMKVSGFGANHSGDYTANGSYTDVGIEDNQSTVSYYLQASDAAGNYRNSSTISIPIGDRTAPSFTYNHAIVSNEYQLTVSGANGASTYDVSLSENSTVINSSLNNPIANTYTYLLPSEESFYADITVKDASGNFVTTRTTTLSNSPYALLDDLNYEYLPNSNRLQNVQDGVHSSSYSTDYDTDASLYQFEYDENGNTTQDLNRGISNVTYNYINLPEIITKTNGTIINYAYDGQGQRIEKKVTNSSNVVTTHRKYIRDVDGSVLAELDALKSDRIVNRPIKANGEVIGLTDYKYVGDETTTTNTEEIFHLNDHLGNVRVTIKDKRSTGGTYEIVAKNDFYPFGLTMTSYDLGVTNDLTKYKYQSMELDFETGYYDFNARTYDPAVIRFGQADPLAEANIHQSTYAAMDNNPIIFVDPTGMDSEGPTIDQIVQNRIDNQMARYSARNSSGSNEEANEILGHDAETKADIDNMNFLKKKKSASVEAGGIVTFNPAAWQAFLRWAARVGASPTWQAFTRWATEQGRYIKALEQAGVKFNKDAIIFATKLLDKRIVWLEYGNKSAGLRHIFDRHAGQFRDIIGQQTGGFGTKDIASFLNKLISNNTPVHITSKGAHYYKTVINGAERYFNVAISNNGFIVSAYPVKASKVLRVMNK
jgi:RHS repeat-associated protein